MTRRYFADTFYFIALINPDDAAHSQTTRIASRGDVRILTTEWVLTELADALSARSKETFCELLNTLLEDQSTKVIASTPDLWQEGVNLYSRRLDKQWSLTDCISFVAMEQHKIREALTGDRHFEQAGFKALLKSGSR